MDMDVLMEDSDGVTMLVMVTAEDIMGDTGIMEDSMATPIIGDTHEIMQTQVIHEVGVDILGDKLNFQKK